MALNFKCKECGIPLGFDGVCWSCKEILHRQEVASWTEQDIAAKKQQVLEALNNSTSQDFYKTKAYDFIKDLLSLGVDCCELAKIACEHHIHYPSVLYYHADVKVCEQLIERLQNAKNGNEAGLLMSCLAMIGDQAAQNAMYEMKISPKAWSQQLFVDSDVYAQEGGWTFNSQNERIPLIFDTCYIFEPPAKTLAAPATNAAVDGTTQTPKTVHGRGAIIGHQRANAETCPYCGCEIVDMLVIDGRDPRFKFLGINGIITASCCPNCVVATDSISCHFNLEGGSKVLDFEGMDENLCGEYFVKNLAENDLVLADKPQPVLYGAFYENICSIGGFANWIQDFEYRECPVCGKNMKYFAQLPWELLESYIEGSLFFEICPDCQVITMFHQQT